MIEKIKEIIVDMQRVTLMTSVKRELQITTLPGKATICMGVRRAGKSVFLCQIMQDLFDQGIARENILYLNFFDDRLHGLAQVGLQVVLEAYFELYPHKKGVETIYCFFDEIQMVPGWESFVDRLMRSENCDVYITGSSAQMLSKEIATQMRGRSLSWEIFPFSFQEFVSAKRLHIEEPFSSKERLTLQKAIEGFWEAGGFPEVLEVESTLRLKIHQEYLHAILFRDLIERYNIAHPKALVDLVHRLIDSISSPYSINSLVGYLKSLGHKTSKETVSHYLLWLEDAYFLFTVRVFDASLSKSHANPKKIYCIDSAMVTSIASGVLVNTGHLLENFVFTFLRRITSDVFYFKTENGKEIDFLIKQPKKGIILIQVCESMADPQTRKRELAALEKGMQQLRVTEGWIITRRDSEEISTEEGKIFIVPLWQFAWEYKTLFSRNGIS